MMLPVPVVAVVRAHVFPLTVHVDCVAVIVTAISTHWFSGASVL